MKKRILFTALFIVGTMLANAQDCSTGNCDCASCIAEREGKFTLPGLQGLEQEPEVRGQEPDQSPSADAHAGHSHAEGDACCPAEHEEHAELHDHSVHSGHSSCSHDHSGHGHDDAGVFLPEEMKQKAGVEVGTATAGKINKTALFPAEIKLNRDTTAAVSPRYPSVVRQVFAEIGDTVKKGKVLASLENRETMAVYTVSAPADGTIISKDLAVGETAGEDKVLYEVADLSTVWADISIFPKYRHHLKKGMAVEFIAHDGCRASGVIRYISPLASEKTRTFTARCILTKVPADFTPGAFVRARIVVESTDATVVIPREAVQMIEDEAVVFIPEGTTFITAHVQPGMADECHVEIRRGLKPGEHYVARGAFALKAQLVTSGMDPHAGHNH